jgi:hypothetical protein
VNPTASKLTPDLYAAIVEQLELRKRWKSWQLLADFHGISRENLFRHIRNIKRGKISAPVKERRLNR